MAKITYEDKIFLNKNEDVADLNKVNDTDLNEIKEVVNQNDDNLENINGKFDELDEKLSPVLLYENTASTTSNNITLSDSAANYEYLEIFCSYDADITRCVSNKVYQPDGKDVNFTISDSYTSGGNRYFYVWTGRMQISGSTITQDNAGQIQFINQGINLNNTTNHVYITRVIGYKKLED